MFVARRVLFTAIIFLSYLHATASHLCCCTSRDDVRLHNDADMKSEIVTIPDRNTCFLGTMMTDRQGKTNNYVAIESFAFGTCADAILDVGGAAYWSSWSNWSECLTNSCHEIGHMSRVRSCDNAKNSAICTGRNNETFECNISCTTNKTIGWSGWMEWNDCKSNSCLNMTTTRFRKCLTEGVSCSGPIFQSKTCTQDLCAVDGGWTEWSPWSTCSKAHGTGFKNRLRSCTNPSPSHGGNRCPDDFWQIVTCQAKSEWTDWEQWGSCWNTANGPNFQFRNRSCTFEDLVDTNESSCHEAERLDMRTCQFYGTWNNWGTWSECSLSQNQGTKTRLRICSIDTAVDHQCIGKATEMIQCTNYTSLLPSEWSEWSECLPPCNGSSKRQRYCDSTEHRNCSVVEEVRKCNLDICTVDGNWASWSEWLACYNVEEVEIRVRNRSCTEPRNGGSICVGPLSEVGLCNNVPEWGIWQEWNKCIPLTGNHGARYRSRTCHVGTANLKTCNGNNYEQEECLILPSPWLDWTEWSVCSVTCETGLLSRTRICNITDGFGPCEGNSKEEKQCQPSPHCPIDGDYSQWTDWSPCPVTCGPGALTRSRYCTNPSPSYGGKPCSSLGVSIETSFCDSPCPVDGQWGDWSLWDNCTSTCGYGTKSRTRTCSNPPASNGGHTCKGITSSVRNCTLPVCSVNGGWSLWSTWSQCRCKKIHTRHRDCNNPTPVAAGKHCAGYATEIASCEPNPSLSCPIDGAWAEWWEWSSRCSVTCGQGFVQRVRQCANPRPEHGGEYCKGVLSDKKPCSQTGCPRDGVWVSWSGWSICSVTCGRGTQVRGRRCDPPPMFGGANCTGDYQEQQTCAQNPCPINGEWSDWESWSTWDATCSFATRSRTRKCDRPAPQNNGLFCVGEINDSESSDIGHCPMDGNWGSWDSWTKCSVTCENGTRTRSRVCDNPVPQYNGSDCVGIRTESEICSDRPSCVIDGNWNTWLDWIGCDVTCGTGTNRRYRTCANPKPQNGGKSCTGDFLETVVCNLVQCPVDGVWSQWGAWRACSVTCANGTRSRSRTCSQPIPIFGGRNCQGLVIDYQSCQLSPCPTSTLPPTTIKPTVSRTPNPTPTVASTPVSTSTKATSDFQCYACDGPLPQLCLTLMKPVTCPEPYCINEFTNDVNGEKLIDRRCGTKLECDQDWWSITSGNDKCMLYDDTQASFHDIHCTFCCKDEICNKLTVPASDSLYTPNI